MREITKGAEPQSLTQHRLTAHCDYDNYGDKDGLRTALDAEQRGLCCYCMGRIRNNADSMKIEHWRCQTKHPRNQLTYRNLLGACLGGMGLPEDQQHCDTRKGNDDIRWNPAEPTHQIEAHVKYDPDGTIRSDAPDFELQLNQVLNLNLKWLQNGRKAALDGLLQWWRGVRKPLLPGRIEREIAKRTGDGELQPFCQVTVWWLRKKL